LLIPLPYLGRAALILAVLGVGALASSRAERNMGQKDPGCVVIDEVLGQWVALAPFAALDWAWIAAGFLLFRLFDILKPWPVKQAELKFPGGFGVMIDDALAGVYAALGLWLLRVLI
jgi:phosphatidylglycerophosphatase A